MNLSDRYNVMDSVIFLISVYGLSISSAENNVKKAGEVLESLDNIICFRYLI